MAGSLNRVMIIGNLGADPEIRTLPSGSPVASLRVACSESWKDKETGERKEKTEWISVACFNEALCGVIEKYLHKGSKVYIEGTFRTRKYQAQDGSDRYPTEVHIERFQGGLVLLDRPAGSGGGAADRDRQYDDMDRERYGERRSSDQPRGGNVSSGRQTMQDDFDDSIPF